jgi:dihydroneopterin aldolase
VIVVKLGGSLVESGAVGAWLKALRGGGGRAAVVTGGGAYAEMVRRDQRRHGFSDRAAHRMALLGMEMNALMLADLGQLVPCRSIGEFRDALAKASIPVWLPSTMALADAAIPESWGVTSDSLAAWLARRLEATTLALVKSLASPSRDAVMLAQSGIVDREFPPFLERSGARLEMLGPGDEGRLARLVAPPR